MYMYMYMYMWMYYTPAHVLYLSRHTGTTLPYVDTRRLLFIFFFSISLLLEGGGGLMRDRRKERKGGRREKRREKGGEEGERKKTFRLLFWVGCRLYLSTQVCKCVCTWVCIIYICVYI
ncbi:hypothetical protein F4778DRAFT_729527 [Xylariomycetidae sp. FL2044]|nr:hypothetical protein F4778DRAFT_729527 [Xylariomycetidae sp. FL2044]